MNKRIASKRITAVILVCVFAFVLSFGHAGKAHAADDEAQTVRVGYYENEVFQEGAADGMVKTGYAYEYYQKLSEYTGWRYEYVYDDFSTLYRELLDGEIDLLAGLAKTQEREEIISYPDSAMGNETYSLVKHDADEDITASPESLDGRTFGVLDSAIEGVLEAYLQDNDITAEVITYSDYETLFKAFDDHDIDILAAEGDGAYGRSHAEVLCAFGASDYYLCVSINSPEILKELNEAQEQLANEEPNYISSLRSKYYPVSISSMAFSASETEWIDTHDTLHIGFLNSYLPYSDTDEQGNVTGLVKDIVPKMLESMGKVKVSVTYQGFDSYDDMIASMNDGTIDAAFPVGGGLYYSEENGIYQSTAVISSVSELVYKGDYDENTTARFAVNENNRMQFYYIRTHFPEAEITFYPSIDACLDAVVSGKEKATTLNGMRANDYLKNTKYSGLSLLQLNAVDDRGFGVKIGNEGLLKLINRGINILGSDYAQNMAYRYTDQLYKYTIGDMIKDHIWLFGSIILAAAALVMFFLIRDSRRNRKRVKEKEEARARLEETNSELAKNRAALSTALEEAEQANRAKTDFLNNMSHDIRTPMNAIVGFTALAENQIDDKEQVRDYLGKISVSSKHLLSLINDVLDMSRIESGNVTIEETDVNLPGLIEDISSMIRTDVSLKKQQFTTDTEGLVHSDVITDRLRLNQIILNILSNAIKFTPEEGKISLTVTEEASSSSEYADLLFIIRDNGIGMSEEFLETLFDPFTREKSSTVSGIQGTGLGMAITRNLVEMMGGTISVTSAPGEGSEFTVSLKCRAGSGTPGRETVTKKTDFSGKRILLAEDNEMNQQIALAILEDAGFAVDLANDGTQAVEIMEKAPAGKYDMILMDIQMPVMDGYEAARRIRAMEAEGNTRTPIVAVTANVFEEDKKDAISAGMDAHLPKPYDVPKMMKTIEEILEKQESAGNT